MKVEKATIEFEDGETQIVEFEGGTVIELAHELIKQAQPESEILITESMIEEFRREAKSDYMNSTKLFTDFEAYQGLYVRLSIREYRRVEHAKNSYNEAVMGFATMKKKMFHFDYTLKPYKDDTGHFVAEMKTESIEAWDEEHATLLFEKMHPGKSYDKPY